MNPATEISTRLPAGPGSNKWVSGVRFLMNRQRYFGRLQQEYGDVFTIKLPGVGNTVIVTDPELIKTIFTASNEDLHAGKNPLGAVLGPGSVFSMDGQRHIDERRLLLPALHGDRLSTYSDLIETEALEAMSRWPEDKPVKTIKTFNQITLRVILRAVFGAEGANLARLEREIPPGTALGQRLVTLPPLRRDLGRFSPGGRFKRYRAIYDEIVGGLVDERLADPQLEQRTDILSMMILGITARGDEVNRSEICDELLTLLVAGHETTASSLAWAAERLSRHPEAVAALEAEIEAGGSELRQSMINELQRHRTIIAGVGRVVMRPFQLGEHLIPPGWVLMPASAMVHRDGRIYEREGDFVPDRFLHEKPGTYTWIPFGGGVRRCPGASFAQLEMDIVLRTMLTHYELVQTDAKPERESFRGVAYAPSRGGVARFRRRSVPLKQGRPEGAEACPVNHSEHQQAAGCPVDHTEVARA